MNNKWIYIFPIFFYFSGAVDLKTYEEIVRSATNLTCVQQHEEIGDLTKFLDGHLQCMSHGLSEISNDYFRENSDDAVIEKICGKNLLAECLDSTSTKLKPCIKPGRAEVISFVEIIKALKGGINYLCRNDKENLKKLFTQKAKDCFKDHQEELDKCNTDNNDAKDAWLVSSFWKEDKCRQRASWSQCVVFKLDACKNKAATDIVRGTLKAAFQKTHGCHEVLKNYPQLRDSASFTRINVLLMFVTFFIAFTLM